MHVFEKNGKNTKQPTKLMNRNFFLLWQGQSISRLGSQGFTVAMLFWIKHATGSAALMGLLQMLSTLPAVILGPIGGALADRYSRRRIIILSDLLRGLAVLSLTALILILPDATQTALVWLFVVSILIAVVTAFFNPAISASIPDLVPQNSVTSANSLGQLSFQLSVFIGQGLGGTLFRLLGAPILFLIDGMTYLFAAASESFVVIPQIMPQKSSTWKEAFLEFKKEILEGLRYVWRKSGLRELVFVSAFLNFFTAPVIILLPFYVENTLQVQVDWYGFLLAAYGAGTMVGYVFAGAIRLSGKARGTLMMLFMLLEPFGYGALGLINSPYTAMAMAFGGGVTSGFVTVNITTLLQITTPGEIRGRVFGLLGAIAASLTPIAMGLAGVIADLVNQNIPLIYVTCGAIMILLSMLVLPRQEFRHFLAYEPEGEIPKEIKEQIVPLS